MEYGTPELLVRFTAKDRNGREYRLTQYAMSPRENAPSAGADQRGQDHAQRTLYILTEDRQLVIRLGKGSYEICNEAATQLFSDAVDAP